MSNLESARSYHWEGEIKIVSIFLPPGHDKFLRTQLSINL